MHENPNPVAETTAAAELLRLRAVHESMEREHAREVSHLREGLRSRTVIGQATGLLMHEYNLDVEAALAVLRRRSSYANVKLRDIASEMVAQADRAGMQLRPVADC